MGHILLSNLENSITSMQSIKRSGTPVVVNGKLASKSGIYRVAFLDGKFEYNMYSNNKVTVMTSAAFYKLLHDIIYDFNMAYKDVIKAVYNIDVENSSQDDLDSSICQYSIDYDQFTGSIVIQSVLYKFMLEFDRTNTTRIDEYHNQFIVEQCIDYYRIFLVLLNKRLMTVTPYEVKANLIHGLRQPLMCGTSFISCPLDMYGVNYIWDIIPLQIDLSYDFVSLSAISTKTLSEILGFKVPAEIARKEFMFLLIYCALFAFEDASKIFATLYSSVAKSIDSSKKTHAFSLKFITAIKSYLEG